MKIEKIDENKVRITLTIDELSQREISIKDIEQNSNMAQDLFMDLIEESELNDDFIVDGSQLFVEASADSNNLFVVTITKIDYIPEISKYSKSYAKRSKSVKKYYSSTKLSNTKKSNYIVASSIYKFNSLDTILVLCNKLKIENCFLGTNYMYKYNDNYFITFADSSVKNKKFLKTFILLSEYSIAYYSTDIFKTQIVEKATLVFQKNALQKLIKFNS